jgi:DNA-binding transcriptional regulator YhcF (GntR family)
MSAGMSSRATRMLAALEGLLVKAQAVSPSNAQLAELIQVPASGGRARTVNRALAELEAAGLITITYRKQTKTDRVGRSIALPGPTRAQGGEA